MRTKISSSSFSIQIFQTLKLPTIQTIIFIQSETRPRHSMQAIRPQFKPYLIQSSFISTLDKEDMVQVQPTALPEQSSNPNYHVGGDGGDVFTQDSSLTKCTKCSVDSQSSVFDENEGLNLGSVRPKKCLGKKLKKELKKQKIKRKYDDRKINQSFKINVQTSNQQIMGFGWTKYGNAFSPMKNQENTLQTESLSNKIQKLTQHNFANFNLTKKIHFENTQISSKSSQPYLSLLDSNLVKVIIEKKDKNPLKNQFLFDQTVFLQDKQEEVQSYCEKSKTTYFIDDLIEEAKVKKNKKSTLSNSFKKLNFLQSMINLLENYQIPIQNVQPLDAGVEKINLSRRTCDNGKKTLLIDLDNTLIFTEKPFIYSDQSTLDPNQPLISQNDGKYRKLYIRPYAREFLERINQCYEIIIFTAATKSYAEQIRAILDPQNKFISHVLDRQHCFNPNIKNNSKIPYIKDLRKINRPLNQTILLDNSIFCFWYQIQNGIPIISYTKVDQNDQQLLKVAQYLQQLCSYEDIRIKNKEFFKLEKFEEYVDSLTLVEELYIEKVHG